MTWECAECSHSCLDRPKGVCTKCGLVQMGPGTHEKYEILEKYCFPLSVIMRNKGKEHYFIDACAGSGIVQQYNGEHTLNGSPLIFAETREKVQEYLKDKTKKPELQCKFIENNKKTFNLLKRELQSYDDFCECIQGDCNYIIDDILDDVKGAFSFIYIDPFGVGDPVIRSDTVEKVLERKFTELFIHFSWEGVSRAAGQLKNIDHPDNRLRKTARSTISTLDTYLTPEWQKIQKNVVFPSERRKRFVGLYEMNLKQHYQGVHYVGIPIGAKDPNYYLFFTTRNKTGFKIMQDITEKMMRKGSEAIDQYR